MPPLVSRASAATAAAAAAAAAAWFASSSSSSSSSRGRVPPVEAAFQPGAVLRCAVAAVEPLSADASRYRFALPTEAHRLGLTAASHVLAVDGGNAYREYTPVTLDERGYFDLIVRRYPGGYFSEKFGALRVGDGMDFRGPCVTLPYARGSVAALAMVAGGTGITPMYQLIRAVLADPEDATQLSLLYANRTPADVLLKEELDALAAAHPGRLRLTYVVDALNGDGAAPGAAVSVGRVDAAAVARALPPPDAPDAAVLVCGPRGMVDALCGPRPPKHAPAPPLGGLLGGLGFDRRRVVRFD